MAMTPHQEKVFEFIRRFIERHGYAPTLAQIGAGLKLTSSSTIHTHLAALERQGIIRRTPNVSRGIEIVAPEPNADRCEIPLLGIVSAGHPIEAVLNREMVCVPRDMFAPNSFALRVRGDSMRDESINDGDVIVVAPSETAANGQIVIALIDESEATIKTFYRERGRVRLQPANEKYKPIYITPPQRVKIQGVLLGLIRKYQH